MKHIGFNLKHITKTFKILKHAKAFLKITRFIVPENFRHIKKGVLTKDSFAVLPSFELRSPYIFFWRLRVFVDQAHRSRESLLVENKHPQVSVSLDLYVQSLC